MSTFSERKKGRAIRQATSMSYVSQPQSGRAGNASSDSYTTSLPQMDDQHGVSGPRQDQGFGAKSEYGVNLKTQGVESTTQPSLPSSTADSSRPATTQPDPSQAIEFAKTENEVFDLGSEVYEIRHNGQKGRSLWSKSVYKPGSIILKTQARIAVVSTHNLREICSGCFLSAQEKASSAGPGWPSKPMRRCGRCKVVHYCSQECQQADWPAHRPECYALANFHTMWLARPAKASSTSQSSASLEWVPNEARRALGRLCWARKETRDRSGGEVDPPWWKEIALLESHRQRMDQQEKMKLASHIQQLRHYLSASVTTLPEGGLQPVDFADFGFSSVAEIMDLYSGLQVNSFTLSSPSLSPIGVAMSPLIAMANHSCDPNAVVVFPEGGGAMRVVAIREISPGEEITTAYIDISSPYHIRQSELLVRYRFQCCCALCEEYRDQTSASTFGGHPFPQASWAVRHVGCLNSDEGMAGFYPPDQAGDTEYEDCLCDSCHMSFTVPAREIYRLVKQGDDYLHQDEVGTLDRDLEPGLIKDLIKQLLNHLAPSSYPLVPLFRLYYTLKIPPRHLSTLWEIGGYITCARDFAKAIYPQNHPVLAIMLAEYGKLLAMSGVDGSDGTSGADTGSGAGGAGGVGVVSRCGNGSGSGSGSGSGARASDKGTGGMIPQGSGTGNPEAWIMAQQIDLVRNGENHNDNGKVKVKGKGKDEKLPLDVVALDPGEAHDRLGVGFGARLNRNRNRDRLADPDPGPPSPSATAFILSNRLLSLKDTDTYSIADSSSSEEGLGGVGGETGFGGGTQRRQGWYESPQDLVDRLETAQTVLRRAKLALELGFGGDGGLTGRETKALLDGIGMLIEGMRRGKGGTRRV